MMMELMAMLASIWPGWLVGPLAGGVMFFRPKDGRTTTPITFAPPPGVAAGEIASDLTRRFDIRLALGQLNGIHKWEDGKRTFIFTVWTSSLQRDWIIGLMRGQGAYVYAGPGKEINVGHGKAWKERR